MQGPQRLAQVFVELADTLVQDFDVVDFLQGLTERVVELLDADAAGLLLADARGQLRLMAATTERARLVDLFELQNDEGPCLECYATGQAIVNVHLTSARQRWPAFTGSALAAGFRSTHALPLRLRGEVLGTLNLFAEAAAELTDEDVAVGQAMADVATIGLLHERTLREQSALTEQLQTALQSRILLEQAKGVLAERAGVTVDEAFQRMRTYARGTGRPLTVVAGDIVDGSIDDAVLLRR